MKLGLGVLCILIIFGTSGFSSGEKTNKVFNPMLPSQLERYGSYDSLPLEIFGEEPYNLAFDGISNLYYPFIIQTSSISFDSLTRVIDKKTDLLFEREKNRVYLYESINLIVVFDPVEENNNKKLKMTFIDAESDNVIGSALFDHMFNQIEILSRHYYVCDRKLYKIGYGIVETKYYSSCGISNDLYRIDDDVFKRIDDSFVFSLKPIWGSDWHPITSSNTDYFYLATEIFEYKTQNTISIKKVNYEGVEVNRWDNVTLEQGENSSIINDDKMLIGSSDGSNSYTIRYTDLNTRKDLWRISKLPNAKSFCRATFYNGNYYQKSDDIAMRAKEDGIITFAPILVDPIYLTFRGQRYVLKGVPSNDRDKLFLKLVRIEQDCQVETGIIVPFFQHYTASENSLVGWNSKDEPAKGTHVKSFDYQISQFTSSGFKQSEKKSIKLPWSREIPDFENLQTAELISDRKIRIHNLETEKFVDLEITNELLSEEAKIIQISLKGHHIAISFVKGLGKTIQHFIACYSVNPFELLFADELSTVSDGKIRSVNVNFSGQNQEQPYFIGNYLLAWCMRSPFRVYNLIDGTSKVNIDWYHVSDINGTLYCISDGKIDIINPVTIQMKTVKFKSDRSFASYLPFIDSGMFDYLDIGVLPQKNLDRYLIGQAFGWYSTVSRLNHPGELIKMESCPTFSIKRVAKGEFRIVNTSPNCDKPLKANVYLVPWTKEGTPVYWKAKEPIAMIDNLKLKEITTLEIDSEKTRNLDKFALVIESNGLLDTTNSELSDFDKDERPLFDGVPISYSLQKALVVTVWGR